MSLLKIRNIWVYLRLIRFEKPIGFYLLLWPCLWSLWLASSGDPSLCNVVIFVLGAFIMRSAGCAINDYMDRNIDVYVKRTCQRPLATKEMAPKEALAVFFLLISLACLLLLMTNFLTMQLAFLGVVLASVYPFMKRFTSWPQAVLGLAFGYPVLMAWAAETSRITHAAWWLYLGTLLWVISYDTYYAMVDRDDDVKCGIKSTAILFGRYARFVIASLHTVTLIFYGVVGWLLSLSIYYYLALLVIAGLFGYQFFITRSGIQNDYFRAFLNNHWVGAVMFMGVLSGS